MVTVYPFWLVDVCEMQRFTHIQQLKILSPLVQAKEKNPMSQTICLVQREKNLKLRFNGESKAKKLIDFKQ
jgi:hypothetical protein